MYGDKIFWVLIIIAIILFFILITLWNAGSTAKLALANAKNSLTTTASNVATAVANARNSRALLPDQIIAGLSAVNPMLGQYAQMALANPQVQGAISKVVQTLGVAPNGGPMNTGSVTPPPQVPKTTPGGSYLNQ